MSIRSVTVLGVQMAVKEKVIATNSNDSAIISKGSQFKDIGTLIVTEDKRF